MKWIILYMYTVDIDTDTLDSHIHVLPLSLYCSPLMAFTVNVCESSSLGEITAPPRGNVPRGFWVRDCSLTKYSRSPNSLFRTKNLDSENVGGNLTSFHIYDAVHHEL